ncbi:TPA: methionine--tRNA ligase [Candidatus Taylorbacteria bacterium]|nr:methionine--tRNA ligase [Candidatus Taylorbacteria bacterium]
MYKRQIKYCVGCELEKTDSELVDGKCPLHPHLTIELIDEENYFFRFSKFQKTLLDLYEKNPKFVVPDSRFNEIKAFVGRGLEDFSISRLASKMPWGVPVPGDDKQVMYVWFDALVNYISTLGWPENTEQFEKFWVGGAPVQYCGKDNLRQQSAMWQAMLISAGLTPTHTIVIDGFVTGPGGVKMSKSLGNVINPYDIVAEFGTDALRYFVLRELSPFEDSPFSIEQFKQSYNANLANGIGNLVSRIMKMATSNGVVSDENALASLEKDEAVKELDNEIKTGLENFNLQRSMNTIWKAISIADQEIQSKQPFKIIKVDKVAGEEQIKRLLAWLKIIGRALQPFLPSTSDKITEYLKENKMPEAPLFMRRD